MNKGRLLYEKYRRHEPDAERWDWLDQEVREFFWDRLCPHHRDRRFGLRHE